jgi:hypothetical protein
MGAVEQSEHAVAGGGLLRRPETEQWGPGDDKGSDPVGVGGCKAHGYATPERVADDDRRRREGIQNRGDESGVTVGPENLGGGGCCPETGEIDRQGVEFGQ